MPFVFPRLINIQFKKENGLNITCVFIRSLRLLSETLFIVRIQLLASMHTDVHVQYPFLLSDFNQLEVSRQSFEYQIS